ncbi:MAG: cysteine--tRNA ligase [bacterium]|nr:cysteine--tRNA ligase [bacterium]
MDLVVFNTRSRAKEIFKPIHTNKVSMYGCGPTVYDYAHIGNFRAYIVQDFIRRSLTYLGNDVMYAMNITDVGHLTDDADSGEDKLQKRAREHNIDPLDLARKFEKAFWHDISEFNIQHPSKTLRATEAITEQLDLISILLGKGVAYQTTSAIYFDVTKAPDYDALSGQKLSEKSIGARDDVITDTEKRNPADFVLWFFLTGRYTNHLLHWPSPWGEGFPGWHLECSAISRELLGQPFDIHMGGVDHIPVHHTNEIAQSETAFDTTLANYWLHNNFLTVNGGKMSKSLGNSYTLSDLKEHGIPPLAFRFFTYQAHYRSTLNVTWEGLEVSRDALRSLYDSLYALHQQTGNTLNGDTSNYVNLFEQAISDDFNAPVAVATLLAMIKDSNLNPKDRYATALKFDNVLALGMAVTMTRYENIPSQVQELFLRRNQARKNKDFVLSDELRDQLYQVGFEVRDNAESSVLLPLLI